MRAQRGQCLQIRRMDKGGAQAGGWGLYTVDSVADRWGVANTGSKSVWLEIDLDE